MSRELNFGPYVDFEDGRRVVKDLTFGNPTPEGVVLTTLDSAVNWMRKSSIWPMTFGLACCAIEMMSMGASRFDIARFGAEVFRPSPRQSDLMIIAGRVSNKMAPVIRQLWEQMPEPSGSSRWAPVRPPAECFQNYALVQSVNQVIPVDIYVPGCPPRPEQLIYAITLLQEKIQKERGTIKTAPEPGLTLRAHFPATTGNGDPSAGTCDGLKTYGLSASAPGPCAGRYNLGKSGPGCFMERLRSLSLLPVFFLPRLAALLCAQSTETPKAAEPASSAAPAPTAQSSGSLHPMEAPIPANAPHMTRQTRLEIIRDFETRSCTRGSPFPMGTKGLSLKGGAITPAGPELQQLLALWGPAVRPGDPAHISYVQIKDNHIHFDINGGPVHRKKWYQRIQVAGANGAEVPLSPTESQQNPHGSYPRYLL